MFQFMVIAASLIASPPISPDRPIFEKRTTRDGLSQSEIFCITQDHQGFLWIGTEDGLNRFDGHKFTVYRDNPDATHRLGGNAIRALAVAADGTLWIATDRSLVHFDPLTERFHPVEGAPRDQGPHCLFVDSGGTLWVGSKRGTYSMKPGQPVLRFDSDLVANAFVENQGILYLGSQQGGLFARHDNDTAWQPVRPTLNWGAWPSPRPIQALHIDHQNTLWIGTDDGLFQTDLSSFATRMFQANLDDPRFSLSHDHITTLTSTHDHLWVGSYGGGLQRIAFQSLTVEHFGNVTMAAVWSLFVDRTGVLWVGSSTGGFLLKLPRQHFNRYSTDSMIWRFDEGPEGMWVGTYKGLHHYPQSGGIQTFHHDPQDPHSLSSNKIFSLARDHNRKLWVAHHEIPGVRDGGLDALDVLTGKVTRYPIGVENDQGLPHQKIWTLLCDSRRKLWIGTEGGGLHCFEPQTQRLTSYTTDNSGLSHNDIWPLVEDANGNLWVGTNGGGLNFWQRATQKFTTFRRRADQPQSLANDQVWALALDDHGDLWVGTHGGGLHKLRADQQSFERWSTRNSSLPNDTIYGILFDEQKRLWISTNQGLAVLNQDRQTFILFTQDDGLQDSEFNYNAAFKDRAGHMWFGGPKGYNWFDPARVLPVEQPHIRMTGLTQTGGTFTWLNDKTPEIVIPYNRNSFSITFALFQFQNPYRHRFRYRLRGAETHWTQGLSSNPQATYTFVPPGRYTFEVTGSDSYGQWAAQSAQRQIIIPPPIWQTWWFRILVGTLAVLSIVAFCTARARHRLRQAQQTLARNKANARLIRQKKAQERQSIANRIHRGPIQVITYLHLLLVSEIAKLQKAAPDREPAFHPLFFEIPNQLKTVGKELRQVCTDVTSGWDHQHRLNGNIEAQINRYRALGATPNFTIKLCNDTEVRPEVARAVFWTFRDGTDNILKHAGAGSITVITHWDHNTLVFHLRDDGCGFQIPANPDYLRGTGHLGILSMITETENADGTLSIHSSPGNGTQVEARYPHGHQAPVADTRPKESSCPSPASPI